MYYYVAHEPRHRRQAWSATARRRYKRSSHGGSTARADSRLSPCMRTRARAHTHIAQAACSLFFLLSLSLSSFRRPQIRSGPFVSPIYVTRRGPSGGTRRCRKRVRFNAVLLLPAYNTRSPPIAPLSFCSLRASLRARYTYRAALSLRSAFVATVKLALRDMHLSLIPEANSPTMDHKSASMLCGSTTEIRWCQRSTLY